MIEVELASERASPLGKVRRVDAVRDAPVAARDRIAPSVPLIVYVLIFGGQTPVQVSNIVR
jgi:hypothetical protein